MTHWVFRPCEYRCNHVVLVKIFLKPNGVLCIIYTALCLHLVGKGVYWQDQDQQTLGLSWVLSWNEYLVRVMCKIKCVNIRTHDEGKYSAVSISFCDTRQAIYRQNSASSWHRHCSSAGWPHRHTHHSHRQPLYLASTEINNSLRLFLAFLFLQQLSSYIGSLLPQFVKYL